MQFRNFALAALVTSGTALGAFAADKIEDDGQSYEDAAEVSGQYIYDRDTYSYKGQTVTNVGGEIRSEENANVDEDSDAQMSETEATSAENIAAAAEQGMVVTSSDDKLIGTVAYTQRMANGYRVFVTVDEAADIPAAMIGFDTEGLEVKTAGDGIEYLTTLEQLREDVRDRI